MFIPLLLWPLLMAQSVGAPTSASTAVIVSVKHPTDSRGETVYETQGESQKTETVVSGVLLAPRVIKSSAPKFSKALRKNHFTGDITIVGVITSTGDYIDFEVVSGDDAEAIACAKRALEQYRFAPATLDGKAVAVQLQTVVHFEYR